jgi:hypothetical protein
VHVCAFREERAGREAVIEGERQRREVCGLMSLLYHSKNDMYFKIII